MSIAKHFFAKKQRFERWKVFFLSLPSDIGRENEEYTNHMNYTKNNTKRLSYPSAHPRRTTYPLRQPSVEAILPGAEMRVKDPRHIVVSSGFCEWDQK